MYLLLRLIDKEGTVALRDHQGNTEGHHMTGFFSSSEDEAVEKFGLHENWELILGGKSTCEAKGVEI